MKPTDVALDWLAMLTGKPSRTTDTYRVFTKHESYETGGFRRDLLPDPVSYYTGQGLKLTGKGAWRSCCCPFHEEKHPSFAVRVENGAFRCQACGVKGGDVLAYHRQRYGMQFKAAAQELGAWEGC
jgi:CHC2 zinc finger